MPGWSVRMEQAESNRLAWAFVLSLAVHLLVVGSYYTGKRYHLWQNLHWPAWLRPVQHLVEAFKHKPPPPLLHPQEPPLMFVEVNPLQATAEPPKNAKYYSDKNSRAANPQPKADTQIPEISGTQTHLAKTESVPRKEFKPLQPSLPKPPPPKPPAEQAPPKPKAAPPPGDLALAKPEPAPAQKPAETLRPHRPTVRELLAQQQARLMPGEMMKQEGGVRHHLEMSSFDAKATPFGAYDYALIAAVQQRWYALLDQRDYAADGHGKVVINFVLHEDGRVSDVSIAASTVTDILGLICEKAISDPAPYQAWPSEMRATIGETRNVQFTFYYN